MCRRGQVDGVEDREVEGRGVEDGGWGGERQRECKVMRAEGKRVQKVS